MSKHPKDSCPECGGPKDKRYRRCRACTTPWNWKGGRVDKRGYVLRYVGKDHHLAHKSGYAYEHRLIAEEKIGRRLEPGEEPHHVNEDKSDNRPENIAIKRSHAYHQLHHRTVAMFRQQLPNEPNPDVECACGCGATFPRYDEFGRPRRYRHGHGRWLKT